MCERESGRKREKGRKEGGRIYDLSLRSSREEGGGSGLVCEEVHQNEPLSRVSVSPSLPSPSSLSLSHFSLSYTFLSRSSLFTSLLPSTLNHSSGVVTRYLQESQLQPYLDALGYSVVGRYAHIHRLTHTHTDRHRHRHTDTHTLAHTHTYTSQTHAHIHMHKYTCTPTHPPTHHIHPGVYFSLQGMAA